MSRPNWHSVPRRNTPRLVGDSPRSRVRPIGIFAALGFLLIALAFAIKPHDLSGAEFWTLALLSAAFIFLTVAGLNLLWGWLGGDPLAQAIGDLRGSMDLLNDSQDTGVQRILSVSGTWSYEDWVDKLRAATEQVDLMGFNLLAWWRGNDFENDMLRLAQRGVRVRALIMDERHPYLDGYFRLHPGDSDNGFRSRSNLEAARMLLERIERRIEAVANDELLDRFQFRTVRNGKMTFHICRIDDELVAIPYLFSVRGSQAPLLVMRGREAKVFRTFESEFEQLWDANVPDDATSFRVPRPLGSGADDLRGFMPAPIPDLIPWETRDG